MLMGCDSYSYSFRFRLTVEVDTPEGLRTGSSVIEVTVHVPSSFWKSMAVVTSETQGEAVFVDVGNGRNVIATLMFGPMGNEERLARLAAIAAKNNGLKVDDRALWNLKGKIRVWGEAMPT